MNRLGLVLWLTMAAGWRADAGEPWTLERATSHALTNSPDARLAQQRIAAARAGIEQANSALWPQVQVQSTYYRTDNPVAVFGSVMNQRSFSPALDFNNVPDADNLNIKGTVTYPLYSGGQIKSGRRAARAYAEAARQGSEAVKNALGFEVARAFHTVLKTRQFIQATEAAVRSYENNLAIANKRFAAGTLLKTDVLDVGVRLAQAREDLVRARNGNALAERALRTLLGLEEGEFTVASAAPAVAAPASGDFTRRPELTAAQERVAAAEAEHKRAKGAYQPRVGLFGSMDYDHGWEFNGESKSWTAGLVVQWDVWNGHLTRGKVQEARANAEAAHEEARKLRLAIGLETEQAQLNLKEATERLAVTEKAVAQAAESVELTRARFEQGLAIGTQLIDAETALTAARVRRAEAEADMQIAIAALRKALGLPQLDSTPTTR